jgi:ligand-binding sensor domain-containing protein/two-component sensor histidine kinase
MKKLFFSAVLLLPLYLCYGQVYYFKKYTTTDGLIQNTVKIVKQDKHGRLWIGTSEGLSIYDGTEFINYSHKEGLVNSVINCFYEVNDTIMLVGSNGSGVYIFLKPPFDKDTLVKIFSGKKYLINNNVNMILKDWDNNYWFCTDSGLTKWMMPHIQYGKPDIPSDRIEVKHYGKREGFPGLYVYGTVDYQNKILWFGTEIGLIRSDGDKFFLEKEFADNFIYAIHTEEDSLIIATSERILTYRKGRINNFNKNFNITDLSTGKVLKDNRGIYWFPTSKGLLKTDGKEFTVIDRNFGLDEEFLFSVIEDREGIIWVGSVNGLYKFSEDSFTFVSGSDKIPKVRHFRQDMRGNIWAITSDGIYNLDKSNLRYSEINSVVKKYGIIDLIFPRNNEILVSTLIGIFHLSYNNITGPFKLIKVYGEKELAAEYSYRMSVDKENNIWVQRKGGQIFLINNGQMKPINNIKNIHSVNLPEDVAYCMYNDSKNNTWIGFFQEGLFRFSADSVFKFTAADGLTNDFIRYIYEDSKGNIWIGTRYRGVFKYSGGKFTQYTTENGLSSNWVLTIVEDESGNLWFSTAKGVTLFDGKLWKTYDETDGIKAGEIYASAVSVDGKVFFGATNGIYFHSPKTDHKNIEPIVHIRKFQFIDGRNAGYAKYKNTLNNSLLFIPHDMERILNPAMYEFGYRQNSFIFEFTSTAFKNEKKNLYSYMLEGFDENWSRLTDRNYISYVNLPTGNYKFLVKAVNSDGIWSRRPSEINFTINPPFWEELWFRILALLFIVGSVALVTTIINRYHLKQALKIEKMRTKIATDLHDEIGTSLSGIAIFSQLAKRKLKQGDLKSTEMLDKIETSSRELIDSMSDIVWSINPQNDSLEDAVLKMEDYAIKLFEAKGIDLQISVSKEIDKINLPPDLRRNLLLIFKEMITNVVKHSGATKAYVEIKVEKTDRRSKTLIMKVEDDGIGFDVNKVYAGSGLKNLKARSDLINGEIKVFLNENQGTSYLFKLLLNNS